ncbi:hypothetical protein [Paenibacillus humicola]|uniref:hypothetical protein n=1 Tax=Paenibacillus humicola TaxID=3110540 RepID=UPI00237ABD8D|nr:hypothetical protein [Paenibacillus humicola]
MPNNRTYGQVIAKAYVHTSRNCTNGTHGEHGLTIAGGNGFFARGGDRPKS